MPSVASPDSEATRFDESLLAFSDLPDYCPDSRRLLIRAVTDGVRDLELLEVLFLELWVCLANTHLNIILAPRTPAVGNRVASIIGSVQRLRSGSAQLKVVCQTLLTRLQSTPITQPCSESEWNQCWNLLRSRVMKWSQYHLLYNASLFLTV